MPTGTPIAPKCPKCMRGKCGHRPVEWGVRRARVNGLWVRQRERWTGRYRRTQSLTECLDCHHQWWSSLWPKDKV